MKDSEINKIKIGSFCILKSGSPLMVISNIKRSLEVNDDCYIKACYFVGNDYCEIQLDYNCFNIIGE